MFAVDMDIQHSEEIRQRRQILILTLTLIRLDLKVLHISKRTNLISMKLYTIVKQSIKSILKVEKG